MGDFVKEDDCHIGSLFDGMNHRFMPPQRPETGESAEDWVGGVTEMAELQKEFSIFQEGRPFATSMNVLGFGLRNARARNRWLRVLRWLKDVRSPTENQTGDQAIVKTIIDNLASASPMPVYFTSHDDSDDPPSVRIEPSSRPLHYMNQDYITISLPLKPRTR